MKVPSSTPNPATGSCHCALPGQMTGIYTTRRWQCPARLHGTLLSLPWAMRPSRWKAALKMKWRLRPVVSGWLLTLSLQEPGSGSGDGYNKVSLTCVCPRGAHPAVKNPPFTLRSAVRPSIFRCTQPHIESSTFDPIQLGSCSWEWENAVFNPVGWIPTRRIEGPAVFSEKEKSSSKWNSAVHTHVVQNLTVVQ